MNFDKMKHLDKEHLLDLMGLETKRSSMDVVMPALALLGVGMAVGAGFGLLLAPRTGRDLREAIARRVQSVPSTLTELPHQAADAMHRLTDHSITHRGQDAARSAADMIHEGGRVEANKPTPKNHLPA